ncbi:hypothetical protein DACRYDRAFT_105289 [Dacryopinax primogenitus]|uniref:Uncharacterized protein n=1 Tax=Dacryopinax primogenitus (strain DJM 731) TaxID=1858805 RepID=M5G6A9_DACPD|nr:uncharacterized protein DACRYDRAFT_105289 [Dacryopinax primogenitus]EJU04224.1 hypothetical protein DACRYDRAFT_105289 [Dacryopinax primogenitus]
MDFPQDTQLQLTQADLMLPSSLQGVEDEPNSLLQNEEREEEPYNNSLSLLPRQPAPGQLPSSEYILHPVGPRSRPISWLMYCNLPHLDIKIIPPGCPEEDTWIACLERVPPAVAGSPIRATCILTPLLFYPGPSSSDLWGGLVCLPSPPPPPQWEVLEGQQVVAVTGDSYCMRISPLPSLEKEPFLPHDEEHPPPPEVSTPTRVEQVVLSPLVSVEANISPMLPKRPTKSAAAEVDPELLTPYTQSAVTPVLAPAIVVSSSSEVPAKQLDKPLESSPSFPLPSLISSGKGPADKRRPTLATSRISLPMPSLPAASSRESTDVSAALPSAPQLTRVLPAFPDGCNWDWRNHLSAIVVAPTPLSPQMTEERRA